MNPAATAVFDEHVVMLADQRDLMSLLPSTTGTLLQRTANVALFCDPLSERDRVHIYSFGFA